MNKVGVEMNKPVLVIEDLTVSFDGFKAVSDLNFYLDKNEVHVVIGPNGAGKTTVLDLICGKTKATSGTIKFNDIELTKLKEFDIVRKGLGVNSRTRIFMKICRSMTTWKCPSRVAVMSLVRCSSDAPKMSMSVFVKLLARFS